MTAQPPLGLQPADFFVLRTPLLPFDELERFSHDLEAAHVDEADRKNFLAADRRLLRARLGELVARPAVREALFLASPSLLRGLDAWRANPESKKGQRAEQAMVRYLYRMASRPTPFGLFSGCSLGRRGETTSLRVETHETARRHTRLDMDYLFALCEQLGDDDALRHRLRYRPSSSLYRAAGKVRYVEPRVHGRARSHHLVAVDAERHLLDVLDAARDGLPFDELARGVAEREDVALDEAEAFLHELIDSRILVSSLSPQVTGSEPLAELVQQLGEQSETRSAAACLHEVEGRLDALDAAGLGHDPGAYRSVARQLEALPPEVEMSRLLQVDLIKPAPSATVGPEVVAEIERGVQVLRRLAGALGETPLDQFRRDFEELYGPGRRVPLVEALDHEVGVGFGASRTASPLLEGLAFGRRSGVSQTPWGAREHLLFDKLLAARQAGASEISIDDDDLKQLPADGLPPLPATAHAMASVASGGEILLRHLGGPSGANLLGRFCHADEALRRRVEDYLRLDEQGDPEAVYAELVHLPQGRVGNVLLRPVLRAWEIPYLGRSGAPPERQIPLDDLLVAVEEERVVLYSKRLGRRVVPRLTTAHNFVNRALGPYRFLASLQHQGVQAGLMWQWAPFDAAAFLPRVVSGRLVLARARWRLLAAEIEPLTRGGSDARFAAVQRWRRDSSLPRHVVLLDGDNELVVDLDNALSIEAFLSTVKKRPQVILTELFPSADALGVEGPDGRYVHELLLPLVGSQPESPAREGDEPSASERDLEAPAMVARRSFLPGSEWLYAKLFTGAATADETLTGVVGPLTHRLQASGAVDRWFFLRYNESGWHLRLRLHGDPRRLAGEALPALQQAVAPLLDDGRLRRLQLDTYERELERYGAGDGIRLAERVFHHDSEAVLALLEHFQGDAHADSRWLLAARGIDRLLADCGDDLEARAERLEPMKTAFANELGGPGLRKVLADRLRSHRRRLEEALETVYDAAHPLAPGFRALEARSRALAPVLDAARRARDDGRLGVSWQQFVASIVHMFTNRLLRAEGRAHEMVLYDFIEQTLRSRIARETAMRRRRGGGPPRDDATRPARVSTEPVVAGGAR
ncbi:MAG: lantibiotic dehydratase [Acidobacteriota bacterium]